MLAGHKNAAIVAAEVKLLRQNSAGAFLVLEGRDDEKFWKTRRHTQCAIINAEGKKNVVGGITRLDRDAIAGALGIIDTDYDVLEGQTLLSGNLVRTDAHDLECLLCRSSALDAVLAEHGDDCKIASFESRTGTTVRQALLDRALIFGRLRWAAIRHGASIPLSDISPRKFVCDRTWDVDQARLLAALPDTGDWEDRVAALPQADPWMVAQGHDVVELLAIGLRKVLGALRASIGREQIAGILRQAMPKDELAGTDMAQGIRAWESANIPYAVLAPNY